MKTRTIAGWGVAVLMSGALAAAQPAAGPGRQGKPGMRQGMMGPMARALELTDEQKAAFRKAMELQRPEMQALHNEMRENRVKLQELLTSGNPDPAEVGRLVIQEHKLREQGKARREQSKQALRALLTPEQQAKFDLLQSMRRERGEGRPGAFGRRHKGAPAPEEGGEAREPRQ
jgi:Spy/CpxP family protein refolding chaperone